MTKRKFIAIFLVATLCFNMLLPIAAPIYAQAADEHDETTMAEVEENDAENDSEADETSAAPDNDADSADRQENLVVDIQPVTVELPIAATDTIDRWNLANFVYQLVLRDSNGNVIPPGGDVVLYEHYEFVINFRESAETQFSYGTDGYLRYQLPINILIPDVVTNVPILAGNGMPIGRYSVSTDGLVTVRFDECDRYGNSTPGVNLLDQYTDIAFTLNLGAHFREVGEFINVDFGGGIRLTVIVHPPGYNTRLDVEKSHFGYNKAERTIDYEILITARNGEVSDISLRDWLGGTHVVTYELASASLTEVTVQVRDETPYIVSPIPWNGQSNTFILDFPDVTLGHGETIRITYTLDVDPYIRAWGEESSGRRNYEFSISNGVSVSGVDMYDSEVTDSHSIWLVPTNRFMNKWATQTGDGTLRWSCSVGDGITLLNGVTITDQLGPGMTITDTTLRAELYDKDGLYLGWESFTVYADRSGFTYAIPDGFNGRDIYSVYINYDVEVDFSLYPPDGIFRNRLELDLEDDPYIIRQVHVNPPGVRMEKGHTLTENYIEWTINFYIPGALYGEMVWLEDYLDILYLNEYGQHVWQSAVNQPENFTVTARRLDGSPAESFHWTLLDSRDPRFGLNWNVRNVWQLFFVEELIDTQGGRQICTESKYYSFSPFAEDTVLTVTYRTPFTARLLYRNVEDATFSGMRTVGDVLRQMPVGSNFAEIRNMAFAYQIIDGNQREISRVENFATWPVHKTATPVAGTDDTFRFTVVLQRGLFQPGAAAMFIDTFDARMEYVPYSFVVEHRGDRFIPRTDGGGDAILNLISYGDGRNTMTVDFSAPYMRRAVGGSFGDANPGWFASTESIYVVRYEMRIADLNTIDQQVYRNTASVQSTTRNYTFSDSYELRYGTKMVQKSWELIGNIAEVEILINPDGQTLTSVGYFEVVDTMSQTLTPYLGTMRVFQLIDEEWVEEPLTQIPAPAVGLWNFAVTGDNEFTFILPDGVPLLLTYEVLIKGDMDEAVDIYNEILVAGRFRDSVSESFVVTSTSGGGSANRQAITLYKNDSEQAGVFLQGADFALYIGTPYQGWAYATPPDGVPQTFRVGDMLFFYIESQPTDATGRAQFDSPWLTPTHETIYALVEIEAPIGYILPADAVTLFSYIPPTPDQLAAIGGKTVEQVADSIMIANDREPPPWIMEIPLLGGLGTVLFIVGGAVLIGGAAIVIWGTEVRKRRKRYL
ncbi:MAG: hypothetical protein FWE08_08785 [Oscillospiraceae bacterium]|nr:hypothetical protein [Oscillospiraceae bacterium]